MGTMTNRSRALAVVAVASVFAVTLDACGGNREEHAPAHETRQPAKAPAQPAPPARPPAADEACAQVIVVAWHGAEHAAETVTRDESAARARAEELRARIERGEDFAAVARAQSDAASTGPRGGLMGTYTRDEWPPIHGAIRDAVFRLGVGQTSEVLHAPYGYVIARRCAVEKLHTRHILIRYRGAKNAGPEITRTKQAAAALAAEVRNSVKSPGADFAAIARERSEDSSRDRGGDLGNVGRGRFAAAYEEAAWALQPGEISDVVETEFGYHIIQRVE